MSEATQAKTASKRATIALRKIKAGQTGTRSFYDCFEMGDGDNVVRIIIAKAKTDLPLRLLLEDRGFSHWLKPGYLT